MYFFDTQDFAFPRGSATGSMQIFWRDTWYSHYYMRDFVFVNNPDGTLGIYYDANEFTGSTKNIQNFTSQITEEYCNILSAKFDEVRIDLKNAFYNGLYLLPECYRYDSPYTCASERFATYFQTYGLYKNVPNCYWDTTRNVCATKNYPVLNEGDNQTYADKCCGDDFKVDFDKLTTEPLSAAKTNEQFDLMMNTELVDAKSRKTISTYPTLRALYDRYINSSFYTGVQSSAYNYEKMDLITKKVGNYWTDVVEQVIPSTTIWGNTIIYGNTIFDQQKFQYKTGNLETCINGFEHPSNTSWDFLNDCVFDQIQKFYSTCGSCESGDCNGETITFSRYDLMDDPRNIPTPLEIDSFGSLNCGQCNYSSLKSVIESYPQTKYPRTEYTPFDYFDDFREARNEFNLSATTAQLSMAQGFCYSEIPSEPNLNAFKTNLNPLSPQYNKTPSFPWNFYDKGIPKKIRTYLPYKIKLDSFWYKQEPGSTLKAPGQILSAYTDSVRFIKAVATAAEMPLVGQPGDLITVGQPNTYNDTYWWNPDTAQWEDASGFEDYFGEIRARRDAFLKAFNQFILAMRPLTWAGNYLMLHPLKKWAMQNATPVTGKQIIETNGDCLPCLYKNTTNCETENTFCMGERNAWSNFSCDENQPETQPYINFRNLDLMDSLNNMPSGSDMNLLYYSATSCNFSSINSLRPLTYGLDTNDNVYRAYINEQEQKIDDIVDGLYLGFKKSDFPSVNYNQPVQPIEMLSKYYSKGTMRRIKYTWWSRASAYTEWNTVNYPTHGVPLSSLLSGVSDVKYLSAVATVSELPTTASKGDLIMVGTPSSHVGYAWDPILNSWSTTLHDFIEDQIFIQRRLQKQNSMAKKRNMVLSIKPMLWASEYFISDMTKNWFMSNVSGYTVNTIPELIATNGVNLPPKYSITASTHTLSGFTATTIIY